MKNTSFDQGFIKYQNRPLTVLINQFVTQIYQPRQANSPFSKTYYQIKQYSLYAFYREFDNHESQKEIQIPMKQQSKRAEGQQQDECAICLQPCVKPVKCQGPCHMSFCIQCVVESKRSSKNACPIRCSQPFQVQIPQVPLKCPYNAEDCNISITAGHQLADHFKICLFISPEQRHLQSLRKNYQCQEGHKLAFLDQQAFQLIYSQPLSIIQTNQLCHKCQGERLCRAICPKCSTRDKIVAFCVDCRPMPCTKTLCPMGHRLRRSNNVGRNRYCDMCEIPAQLMSSTAYGYCRCGFDLCVPCHNKLPQHNDAIPTKYKAKDLIRLASELGEEDSSSEWKE